MPRLHPQPTAQSFDGLAAKVGTLVLTALTLLYLAWPLWRAQFPIQIDVNEGWNAYLADAAFGPQPLYPPPAALTGNNYPPLSFYLLGGLQRLGVDALYLGRLFSIAATFGLGAAVWRLMRILGAGQFGALVAALWLLATFARFYDGYVGINDPHLLGLAIMTGAFAWFVARERSGRAVEPAVWLMVLAGFIKHTLIAIPATALLLLLMHDWRRGLRALIAGAIAGAAGLVLCWLAYGPDFFADLLQPRPLNIIWSLNAIGRLQWILPALAIGCCWAWLERSTQAAQVFATFAAVAMLAYLFQKMGDGVADNAAFDLAIAAAIGLGMAVERLPETPLGQRMAPETIRWVIFAIILVRLLASSRIDPYALPLSEAFRATVAGHAQVAREEAKRVAALPGKVYCSVAIVCRMAGKAFVVDGFKQEILIALNKQSRGEFYDRLGRNGIRAETIDLRASIE